MSTSWQASHLGWEVHTLPPNLSPYCAGRTLEKLRLGLLAHELEPAAMCGVYRVSTKKKMTPKALLEDVMLVFFFPHPLGG